MRSEPALPACYAQKSKVAGRNIHKSFKKIGRGASSEWMYLMICGCVICFLKLCGGIDLTTTLPALLHSTSGTSQAGTHDSGIHVHVPLSTPGRHRSVSRECTSGFLFIEQILLALINRRLKGKAKNDKTKMRKTSVGVAYMSRRNFTVRLGTMWRGSRELQFC